MADTIFVAQRSAAPMYRFRSAPFSGIGALLFGALPSVLSLPFADAVRW